MTRRIFVLTLGGAALGLLALASVERDPKVLYNPSLSAPIGWYEITQTEEYFVGDLVAAWLPKDAEILAQRRGYLPENTPVIKTIAAAAGDEYCVKDDALKIVGQPDRLILSTDSQGRDMPGQLEGCRRLKSGKFLLVSNLIETSFDSRYFGEVDRSELIGRAELIGSVAEALSQEKRGQGGARGMGAQGKIKGDGTTPSLSHCLYIDFYSTILRAIVPSDYVICNESGTLDWYQFPIDHGFSQGPRQ